MILAIAAENQTTMAEYLSPGVYVEEFESPGKVLMQGVSTSTAGFVGVAEKGDTVGVPLLVNSFTDFTRAYGGYLSANEYGDHRYLAYAVNQFFANGGGKAYIMRIAPSDSVTAKAVCAEGKEAILSIAARNQGTWGNSVSVKFAPSSKSRTQILEDLGEGRYKVKNPLEFNQGDVVVVDGAGSPEYNVITLVEGRNVTFASPFSADVVDTNLVPAVSIKTCEITVTITYGETNEVFEFLSFNVEAPNFIAKKLAKSALLRVTAAPNSEPKPPIDIIKDVYGVDTDEVIVPLTGGDSGSAAELTDESYIGEDKGPGLRTGLAAFVEVSDVSIMAIPGNTSSQVQLALVQHCQGLASRFAVLDMPKDAKTVDDVSTHREIVDSDYCAMYHPWLITYDPLDKKDFLVPPCGAVMGIYARTDGDRGVHKAPANETVNNISGLATYYNKAEQDILNPKGVNLIRKFPSMGIRVWGARTASTRPLWRYINVRRLFIFLEESIKANTNWVVFEPNDQQLWDRVNQMLTLFLEGVWRSGALVGSSAGEAFYVDIGPNTMTKQDIDEGRLICVIGAAPVKPAEFVIFRVTQKTEE